MYYIKEKSPFEIRWHINIVNSSVSLADAKLLLVLKTVRGNYDITDYIEDIVDNVIRVKLASLTFVGDYSLYLKIQSDSFEEVSLLERFAFRVVKDNDPSVIVDVVELSSDIYVKSYAYDSALSSGSTNAVQNAVLTEALADKQETINDLEDIRSGANKGATALQDVPEEYITETELALLLNNKVDKEEGKGLSTNDYTTAEKNKLASLENYDDSELLTKLAQLDNAKASKGDVEELVEELESNAVLIEDLQNTKIDKEADDYYPQLSVGLADNLAGEDVVASEISFRKSGGGAISDGVARIEAIKGNSVVWNQLALSQGAKGSYDNSAGNSTIYWQSGLDVNYTERINGHKVFISVIDRIGVIPIFYCADKIQLNLLTGLIVTANTTQQDRNGIIAQVPAGVNASWDIDCLFVDLTQMFGVGNEPSTIEEFYQRIPMGVDLYAYNEGEVIHMNAQSLVSCNVDSTICKEQSLDVVRKYFPDGMKSTDTDSDAIRYNKVTNSWEKHIAIKSIKLKDLSWTHVSELGYFFSSPIDARQGNIDGTNISCICEQYQPMSWIDFVSNYMNAKLKSVALYTHPNGEVRVNVCDTEPADVASFLASLTDDDVLYYSAKEPIVTELDDDFNLDYEVWNGGTEKIVSELPTAPLKADIAYGFNAVGKIKELEEKINSGGGGGVSKEYVDSKVTELSAEVGKKVDADFVNNAIAAAITNELNADF